MNRKHVLMTVAASMLVGSLSAQAAELQLFTNVLNSSNNDGKPLAMYQSPIVDDERFFIVRQDGNISIYQGGSVLSTPFLNISSLVSTGGEQGLLDMAFHPDYENNGYIFVNYTNTSGNTVVARYTVSADPNVIDTGSALTILAQNQDFSNHNGGQTQFGPDGYLYISFGDGGDANDPNCRAQETDTFLGKLLRIDVDSASPYGIPADNPFITGPHLPEVWAYGLRNPWRFSFDRATNDLWIADVGQGQREEINRQPASSTGGENYGWKRMEGTLCSGSATGCSITLPPCDDPSFTPPVYDYVNGSTPHCSITGGFVYRGSAIPTLIGKYIYGDYCSGFVWAYDPSTDTNEFLLDAGGSLTSFSQDREGEIYLSLRDGVDRIEKLIPTASIHDWRIH